MSSNAYCKAAHRSPKVASNTGEHPAPPNQGGCMSEQNSRPNEIPLESWKEIAATSRCPQRSSAGKREKSCRYGGTTTSPAAASMPTRASWRLGRRPVSRGSIVPPRSRPGGPCAGADLRHAAGAGILGQRAAPHPAKRPGAGLRRHGRPPSLGRTRGGYPGWPSPDGRFLFRGLGT